MVSLDKVSSDRDRCRDLRHRRHHHHDHRMGDFYSGIRLANNSLVMGLRMVKTINLIDNNRVNQIPLVLTLRHLSHNPPRRQASALTLRHHHRHPQALRCFRAKQVNKVHNRRHRHGSSRKTMVVVNIIVVDFNSLSISINRLRLSISNHRVQLCKMGLLLR